MAKTAKASISDHRHSWPHSAGDPACSSAKRWKLPIQRLLPLALALCWSSLATAEVERGVRLDCRVPKDSALACAFRWSGSVATARPEITAKTGDLSLTVADAVPFPREGETVAILFLVDVSDPRRSRTVEKNAEVIRDLLTRGVSHHRFGLAVFDSDLTVLAPLGATPEILRGALGKLAANGKTTEFYRSLLEGVRLLEGFAAERKAMVIFSDGLAEDEAYRHEDVSAAAQRSDVQLVGLGYAETVAGSTALQRLRRLAEESGAPFAAADSAKRLPEGFTDTLLSRIGQGGYFTVDLAGLPPEKGELLVQVRTPEGGEGHFRHPFNRLPVAAVESGSPPAPAPAPPSPVSAPPPAAPVEASGSNPAVLFAVAGGLFILLLMLRRQHRPTPPAKPIAHLVPEVGDPHPILRTHARIGRGAANDIRLDNDSVSTFHAELHLGRDGVFCLTDLDATNGIWINGERKNSHLLQEGDLIELGDEKLRFRWARSS